MTNSVEYLNSAALEGTQKLFRNNSCGMIGSNWKVNKLISMDIQVHGGQWRKWKE